MVPTLRRRCSSHSPASPHACAPQWGRVLPFAADQAGQSRSWGGIHILADDFGGRFMGSTIGQNAYDKARTYWDGTATR